METIVTAFLFGGALTFGCFHLALMYAKQFASGQSREQEGYLPFSAKSERDEKRVEDTIAPWSDHPSGLGR